MGVRGCVGASMRACVCLVRWNQYRKTQLDGVTDIMFQATTRITSDEISPLTDILISICYTFDLRTSSNHK